MLVLLIAIGLLTTTAEAPSNESQTPRQIIERAIEAQGGEKQVAKLLKPWRAKIKGKSGAIEITGEILHDSLDKGRITTTLHGWIPVEVVAVTNGDHAWQRIAGFTREATGKDLKEMKDGGFRSRKVRFLLPILREPGITLSPLPDTTVSDQPARGVRVQAKGHRDVDIYFNKESGLLAKIESRLMPTGKPVIVLEQILSDYRDFDGLKLATKFTKYENHKLTSVEEFVDLTFVDHIDEREFEKP
jgi:hypothetical protein